MYTPVRRWLRQLRIYVNLQEVDADVEVKKRSKRCGAELTGNSYCRRWRVGMERSAWDGGYNDDDEWRQSWLSVIFDGRIAANGCMSACFRLRDNKRFWLDWQGLRAGKLCDAKYQMTVIMMNCWTWDGSVYAHDDERVQITVSVNAKVDGGSMTTYLVFIY